jgi:PEP-CTERM motif
MKDLTGRLPWHSRLNRSATDGSSGKLLILLTTMFLLLLAAFSLPAFAGNVSMQFNGLPTGNNYSGVPSYPYELSVNGGPNQWMMCIGYREHISGGETWKATVTSVGSLDPNTYLVDYEAAFLFKMAVADRGADPDINAAAWWLLEGAPSLDAGAHTLELLAQSRTYSKGEFSDVLLYTAIPGTESGGLGTAQDFLSTTPEPGTLALFGSGVVGLGGLLRRRLLG